MSRPIGENGYPEDCPVGEWCKECYRCYKKYVEMKFSGQLDYEEVDQDGIPVLR